MWSSRSRQQRSMRRLPRSSRSWRRKGHKVGDMSTTPTLSNESAEQLFQRIGALTRMLRDNMRELGLDKEIERAAQAIPDARDRLSYIASMTEQAAERTLTAVELAQPLQEELEAKATALDKRWGEWFEQPVELGDARALVLDTREFLTEVPEK